METKEIDINFILKSVGCEDFGIPPIRAYLDEDGSGILEWILPNQRIGFTFGPKPHGHGWHVIGKEITASGPIDLR